MGAPPKYLITRKLIRRYFDSYLPRQPVLAVDEGDKLFECWQKHGIDHPRCKEFEAVYDKVQKSSQNYKKKIDGLRIKENILGMINKPLFKSQLKGRFQENKIYRDQESKFFDGL